MKQCTQAVVSTALVVALSSTPSGAQTGTVVSQRRITTGESGFVGPAVGMFGRATAALGDLDGDGVADLAVGSRSASVWILFLNPDRTVRGEQEIAPSVGGFVGEAGYEFTFGTALANLGDLDGDGRPELAVGANRADDEAGALWILSLEADGTVGDELLIADGRGGLTASLNSATASNFGCAVAPLGDVDGDGFTDIAVGAKGDALRGAVLILFLAADGSVLGHQKLSQAAGGAIAGTLQLSGSFGTSVAGIGDRNGDGVPDVAVGAPYEDAPTFNEGVVRVVYLNAEGKAIGIERIEHGVTGVSLVAESHFGFALGALGDLDGDGNEDLAVGRGCAIQSSQRIWPQEVWSLFLAADATPRGSQRIRLEDIVQSTCTVGEYGLSLLGDLDGNGTLELALGAPAEDAVYILELDTSGFLPPVAALTWDTELRSGPSLSVRFDEVSSNNVSEWSWDFGDGSVSSLPDPVGFFSVPSGPTTVTLTVSGFGGSDSASVTLDLSPATSVDTNGSGVNPSCLTAPPPALGQSWTASIDTGSFTSPSLALLVVYAAASSGTFLAGGEVLVDLSSPRFLSMTRSANTLGPTYFRVGGIPLDLSLVGLTSAVQGALIDASGLVLCNGALQVAGL